MNFINSYVSLAFRQLQSQPQPLINQEAARQAHCTTSSSCPFFHYIISYHPFAFALTSFTHQIYHTHTFRSNNNIYLFLLLIIIALSPENNKKSSYTQKIFGNIRDDCKNGKQFRKLKGNGKYKILILDTVKEL